MSTDHDQRSRPSSMAGPCSTDGVPNLYAGTTGDAVDPAGPGHRQPRASARWTPSPSPASVSTPSSSAATSAWSVPSRPPDEWSNAEVYTNLIEMKMVGECEELGTITVTLNPDCLSTGQIRTPFDPYAGEGPVGQGVPDGGRRDLRHARSSA